MCSGGWPEVNRPEHSVVLNTADCCQRAESSVSNPIDTYIEHQRHVLLLGDPDALAASATLARLLLLGLVTGVESYFRGILSRVLRVCPICRRAAADQVIPFGSVDYYGLGEIESALFEGSSFSNVKEVRNRTQKVLGIPVPNAGSLSDALDAFDLVCELRHASVHAHGALTSANARALVLPSELLPGTVQLDVPSLHSLASACLAAVRAYNQYLFGCLVGRWVKERALRGEWASDWRLFRSLHTLFYSTEDGLGEVDAKKAYVPVQAAIHARLAK